MQSFVPSTRYLSLKGFGLAFTFNNPATHTYNVTMSAKGLRVINDLKIHNYKRCVFSLSAVAPMTLMTVALE